MLSATATESDGSGVPTFEDDTLDLGTDDAQQAPIATVEWTDQDGASGSGDSGDDGSSDGDSSHSAHAPKPAGTAAHPTSPASPAKSQVYVGVTAPFAQQIRKVTPTRITPTGPTPSVLKSTPS